MPRRKHNKPSPSTPAAVIVLLPPKKTKFENAAVARPDADLGIRGSCTYPFALAFPQHSMKQNIYSKIFEHTGNTMPLFKWDHQINCFTYIAEMLTSNRYSQPLASKYSFAAQRFSTTSRQTRRFLQFHREDSIR